MDVPPQNGDHAAQAQAQHQNYIIQPNNVIYRWWQWALVLASFYFCFISSVIGTFSAPPLYVRITNSIVSLFFFIDILLSFFVAYWDKSIFSMVNDHRKIAINAAKTSIFGMVLIVPFEVVATLFHPSSTGYHVFSVLAMVRFFYSIRIHRCFSELEENENINFIAVRIAKMMWVCFLVCHYGGCVFYLLAAFHSDVKDTWFSLADPNFVKLGLIKKYVTSMYWALISFTTVGYGDLHPVTTAEQVFSVIFLLVDFGLIAYVTTTIIYLVAPDVGPLGKYRARRVRVLDYCRQIELSAELCNEVSSHLKLEYRLQSQPSEENGILQSLPTTIKVNILTFLSHAVTDTILLNHLSNPIRFQLIQAMEPVLFPPNTSVILENEVPTFLYFLIRGSVDLIFPDGTVTTVQRGNIFGETCVFFNTPQIFTATTREFTHLLMLDRVKLLSILEGCVHDTTRMISNYIEGLRLNNNQYMQQVLLDFENRAKTVGRIDLPVSLWFAAGRRYNRWFDLLVERYSDLDGCDDSGQTAMHLAASNGDVQKVNKLLGIGADPNKKNVAGDVPLFNAVYGGHANVIQAIGRVDNQFLSVPNSHMQTTLHVAVVEDNFPIVQYLVERGVRVDQNDVHGNSPYSLAHIHGGEEILNYLEERAMLFDQFF